MLNVLLSSEIIYIYIYIYIYIWRVDLVQWVQCSTNTFWNISSTTFAKEPCASVLQWKLSLSCIWHEETCNDTWSWILDQGLRWNLNWKKDVYSKSKVCWWYLILNIRPIKLGDQHGVFFFRRKVGDEFYITPMQPIELNSKKKSP